MRAYFHDYKILIVKFLTVFTFPLFIYLPSHYLSKSPLLFTFPTILNTISCYMLFLQMAATLDLFPTISKLANISVPSDRIIDGVDMSPILFENGKV